MFSPDKIRQASLLECQRLGLPVNDALPYSDASIKLRASDEIERRALTLHGVVASSYGFSKTSTLKWLSRNGLRQALTTDEENFLLGQDTDTWNFRLQAHALHAFAWILQKESSLRADEETPDSLVDLFPDLHKAEEIAPFVAGCCLRELPDIVAALDLYYCVDWATTHLSMSGQRAPLNPVAVRYRRWTLEWVLGEVEWNEVSLDT